MPQLIDEPDGFYYQLVLFIRWENKRKDQIMNEEFVKIIIFEHEIEARHMEAILNERNIPHFIKSYHDFALNGLYQFQKGWGHLEAPEKYRDEIEEICDDLMSEQ